MPEPGPAVLERPNPVLEQERVEELYQGTDIDEETEDAPPIYGRCPVCGKPLFPRDKRTGEPRAPAVGGGYDSRARCSGCGTILTYRGDGKWAVLKPDDLSDDDKFADQLGMD
jgi:hypothetical protein